MQRKFGSGTGNSFDAEYLKCKRLFWWQHRQGVSLRARGDGAALIVGSAGHAWMEAFYTALSEGLDDTADSTAIADSAFAVSILHDSDEAKGLGYDTIDVESKSDTALTLLHALAKQFAKRVVQGERTVGCEMEGVLELPRNARLALGYSTAGPLEPGLEKFTVAIDRAFYHPGDDDMPTPGLAIDEYKFTSMASVKQYAENMLLNDQSLGYLYWLDAALRASGELGEDAGLSVVGVRYRIFRVEGRVTDKSYCEVWEPVNRARLDDWYARKCALRAEMSHLWDRPMVEWTANRYAFGPCHSFGRECPYWAMCDEPGDEASKVGEVEDAGTLYVRETLTPSS